MKWLTKLPHMPLSFLSHVRTLPCRLQRNTRGGKRGSQWSGAYILNIHDVTSESFNFSSRSSQTHAELNLTAVKSTQTIKRSYCTVSQVMADGDRLSLYSDKVRRQHQEVRFVDGKWCMAEQPAVSWPVPPQPLAHLRHAWCAQGPLLLPDKCSHWESTSFRTWTPNLFCVHGWCCPWQSRIFGMFPSVNNVV